MTAEQEPDFKQRHLQDVQALLDADTTKLDIGVLVATTEMNERRRRGARPTS